jgi:hypothetical protein
MRAVSFSSFEPPRLDLATSALAQRMLREERLHVMEYARDGAYPAHRAEKDEVEAYVTKVRHAIACGDAPHLEEDLRLFVRGMFMPDEIEQARRNGNLDRLIALGALQWALEDVLIAISEESLKPACIDDPVFAVCPSLAAQLSKDGLVRLTSDLVADPLLRSQRVLVSDGHAVFPHPYLAGRRELISELFDLVVEGRLEVAMAVHPLRLCRPAEVQLRLLEDRWNGITTTPANLDSLEDHDNAINTFHYAPQDSIERFFHPMLGTWFNWDRRSRNDSTDPVRRLYIQEVGLPHDRYGDPYVNVVNPELHAERDTAAHRFTHTDGKVASYQGGTYRPSLTKPNARMGTPAQTRKLWRVDGEIPDHVWMKLVGLFFRGNDLIDEHFEAVIHQHR